MSEVILRHYWSEDFGYYHYHGCFYVDNELLYDCHDESIAEALYNFLKKRGNVSLIDVKTFFRFLYWGDEDYQFYYDDYIDLMRHYSNEKIKEIET